jgi:adenylate cyclase
MVNTDGPLGYDDIWRRVLAGTQWQMRLGHRLFARLPGDPHCKLCAAPLRGAASPLMRLLGKGPWPKNPKFCSSCFKQLTEHHGGAEIECSVMFADVRASTSMAEAMRPVDVYHHMDRFFGTAARILVAHDAIVDRFVGDQAIGIFVPALAGPQHASRAIEAGRALIAATGADDRGPASPIGVGVNTGMAYVGSVGTDSHVDFTALGDMVNVAARLSSAASPGELLVTLDAATDGRIDRSGLERRDLILKGKRVATSVLVLKDRARPMH